jgi:hypothetical protein
LILPSLLSQIARDSTAAFEDLDRRIALPAPSSYAPLRRPAPAGHSSDALSDGNGYSGLTSLA